MPSLSYPLPVILITDTTVLRLFFQLNRLMISKLFSTKLPLLTSPTNNWIESVIKMKENLPVVLDISGSQPCLDDGSTWQSSKNYLCLYPTPGDSDFFILGCRLGITVFFRTPWVILLYCLEKPEMDFFSEHRCTFSLWWPLFWEL